MKAPIMHDMSVRTHASLLQMVQLNYCSNKINYRDCLSEMNHRDSCMLLLLLLLLLLPVIRQL
jgi:hypothetical protein